MSSYFVKKQNAVCEMFFSSCYISCYMLFWLTREKCDVALLLIIHLAWGADSLGSWQVN